MSDREAASAHEAGSAHEATPDPAGRPQAIDRRSFLARGAAVGAGIAVVGTSSGLLDACGSSSGSGSPSTASHPDGISTAKPRRGGSLIFGTEAEEEGFSPTQSTFDATGILYCRTVFDPLAIITEDGAVAPYLAESIVPNAEYTAWTVTLRPGVTFHNGAPCDGAALLANFKAQKAALLTGQELTSVTDIAQTGPMAVTVTMDAPWVSFDFYLAGGIGGQLAWIAEPTWLASGSQTNPVGTGPFVFQEWVPNDHFTATRNHHYWRPGLPYLDSITFKPIPDADQLLASLRSGAVDILHTSVANVTASMRADTSLAYVDDSTKVAGEPDMDCVLLNLQAAPFNNLKVRQAAAMALSGSTYSKVITGGVEPPSTGPFVQGTPFYAPTGYPVPDTAKASALVKEVEKATGKPVSFAIAHTPDAPTTREAEFVQQQMQSAGMRVTLTPIQQAQQINIALTGKFQAQMWRQFGAVDPDLNYIYWSPTNINSVFSINMARNSDPKMQAALLKGRQSPAAADRAAAYQEVGRLMAAELPYLWTVRSVWSIGAEPKVENFNNPTTPAGGKAYGMITGTVWPTQIWLNS
jgi:ABC-type transport system substrate-binding protein